MATNPGLRVTAVRSTHKGGLDISPLRVLAMLLLFCTAAAFESVHLSSLADADVWWHLRTGLWILKIHAVPHRGLFSQYSALPWIASNWGYEVLLAAAYKLIGLRAIPVAFMALKIALAVSAFLLARGRGRNFWLAVSLSIASQCALLDLRPSPNLCSFVFFAVELALLLESRRTGNVRILFWLPLLFALWANLHVQFVVGLIVLFLFFAAALAEEIIRRSEAIWIDSTLPTMPLGAIAAVATVTFLATLLSPYTYHIYEVAIKNATPLPYIAADHSMGFRHLQNYVLLLLAMAAFLALGRRRSRDLFQLTLMIGGSMLAFRINGDAGFLSMASLAIIGDAFPSRNLEAEQKIGARLKNPQILATAGLLVLVFLVAACRVPSSQQALLNRIGESFPVRAADYIRANQLPDSLFNEYQWGGFLTWYLPEYPVAIDGRTDLYGDDVNKRYFAVTNADVPLNADPMFAAAQTILLPAHSTMAEALATIADFRVVYRDNLATVLVRKN